MLRTGLRWHSQTGRNRAETALRADWTEAINVYWMHKMKTPIPAAAAAIEGRIDARVAGYSLRRLRVVEQHNVLSPRLRACLCLRSSRSWLNTIATRWLHRLSSNPDFGVLSASNCNVGDCLRTLLQKTQCPRFYPS